MKIIKYFFEFTGVISLFCVFKIAGLDNASYLGSILGKTLGPFFRSKKIIDKNIEIALGKIDEKRRSAIGTSGLLRRYLQISTNLQVEPQVHATRIDREHEGQGNGKREDGERKSGSDPRNA